MVRIPDEYQEVEYLESTGTQYITTDYFVSTENIRILVDVDTTPTYSEKSFIGNQDNATGRFVLGTYRYYFYGYARSKQSEANVVSTTFSDSIESRYVIDMTYDLDNGEKSMVINGTKYTATHSVSIISTLPVQIFADGKALYKGNWKCRSVVLYDSENLALKLIPCYRKSDNKPGMYDTVSGTFYTNSDTGTFLVGNPVEYSTVSLLEARRRILLNTPHLESISGATASFETDIASNLKECKIYFTPVQEGTGDPSPDNVRPIRGYDSITIYNGQTAVATIPFPQTIYGGYVDLVKGEVVEEYDSDGQEITPNTYSITPQAIRTLRGLNNIWSDANGNIEIKYWTH